MASDFYTNTNVQPVIKEPTATPVAQNKERRSPVPSPRIVPQPPSSVPRSAPSRPVKPVSSAPIPGTSHLTNPKAAVMTYDYVVFGDKPDTQPSNGNGLSTRPVPVSGHSFGHEKDDTFITNQRA